MSTPHTIQAVNRYPLWKYLLIITILLVGVIYSLPNLYPEDPALQISPRNFQVDEALSDRVELLLKEAEIDSKGLEIGEESLLVRLVSEEAQLKAQEVVKRQLGDNFTVALNLAPATPAWLQALNAQPLYRGLDLRGGVHFLLEVDMKAAISQAEERRREAIRGFLREEKLRGATVTREATGGLLLRFRKQEQRDAALTAIGEEFPELVLVAEQEQERFLIRAILDERTVAEEQEGALEQNITTLRSRVNELGVAEPVIQRQGNDRIVVQLPGVQDTAEAKRILGATATLEFRLVHGDRAAAVAAKESGRAPIGARLYRPRGGGDPVLLKRQVIVTGENISGASAGIDQESGSSKVDIMLDGPGAKRMSDITKDNIGKPMGVVFIENRVDKVMVNGVEQSRTRTVEEVINVATIRDQLSRRFQITGLDNAREATELALLLRAGSLRAPMQIVEERTVGPSLGAENVRLGFYSLTGGMILVLLFMAYYYRVFGLIANLALLANFVIIIAVLSMFQAVLTLPGIAGIVLTVGMAVDANVLIFERIREELRNGNSPQASIHRGYDQAFSTILDANVTTFIAAFVLGMFGSGPIRGFALVLIIGIATSMFTAIMGTRSIVNLLYGQKRVTKLSIGGAR